MKFQSYNCHERQKKIMVLASQQDKALKELQLYYWVVELWKILKGTSGHTDLKDAK